MFDNNFLIDIFASEMYGPCKHLPWMRLFESKVFICTRVITRALLSARDLLLGPYYFIKDSLR